jgi:hypothetical protein
VSHLSFPSIKRSQFKNKSCYYLEDKNKLALLEMMKRNTLRIISDHDIAKACQVFNTDFEISEKRSFLGKNRWRRSRKIKESAGRYGSNPKEKQTKIDYFLGRFLHSDVLQFSSSKNSYKGTTENQNKVNLSQ